MAKVTEKDFQIMDFIYEQIEIKGYPPSVREICNAVGLTSTATVHARLKKLENMGYIIKETSKNRSMRLVNYNPKGNSVLKNISEDYDDKYLEVPVYGKVTAGIPITAIHQQDCDMFPLPMEFAKNKDIFMSIK